MGNGLWSDWYFIGCDEAYRLRKMLYAYEVRQLSVVAVWRDPEAKDPIAGEIIP